MSSNYWEHIVLVPSRMPERSVLTGKDIEVPANYSGTSSSSALARAVLQRLGEGHSIASLSGPFRIDADEADEWEAAGFRSFQAAGWRRWGFTPAQAKAWTDAGVSWDHVAYTLASIDCTPEMYEPLKEYGRATNSTKLVSASNVAAVRRYTKAAAVAGVALGDGEAAQWFVDDWDVAAAVKMAAAGVTAAQATKAYASGVKDVNLIPPYVTGNLPLEWALAFGDGEVAAPEPQPAF